MSLKSWVSIFTFGLIALIIYFSRHELIRAFELLGQVNLFIFALIIPLQILSYLAAGEMMFSYLRVKGSTKDISPLKQAGMALEMNFVNHTLPSAGVSGISYMTWRLSHVGVTPARAAAAQLVRYVAGFAGFITLLIIAVIFITLDGNINRWVILISSSLVFVMSAGTAALIYVISSKQRVEWVAGWSTRALNRVTRIFTFGRRKHLVKRKVIANFFSEMHDEYLTLRRDRRILIKPYLWGILFNLFEVGLFVVAFWALGTFVNPAPILIAYGLASIAGFIVVTPGGAGAYEAIMASFLATSGIVPGVAIAGILLTRVAVLIGTIVFGYYFYQRTINSHGKRR